MVDPTPKQSFGPGARSETYCAYCDKRERVTSPSFLGFMCAIMYIGQIDG